MIRSYYKSVELIESEAFILYFIDLRDILFDKLNQKHRNYLPRAEIICMKI